jgi:hypothetical protein
MSKQIMGLAKGPKKTVVKDSSGEDEDQAGPESGPPDVGVSPDQEPAADPSPSKDQPPKGYLKLDATVADQMIVYPTDLGLVARSRQESERLIDLLYVHSDLRVKPRTYRRLAHRSYLAVAKKRNKAKRVVRKAIGQQLRYLRRNLSTIDQLLDSVAAGQGGWVFRDWKIYWVIQHIYDQQYYMYSNKVHSCPDRIVNIYQPYVRPIVRGKDKARVEFGAKLGVSECDGFSRIDHLSWDAYNECGDLQTQVETYREFHGCYPKVVLVDQIYLTRDNRNYLKEHGIRHCGPELGRPKPETDYQRRRRRKERGMRNHIEAKFGQGKNAYGLRQIRARRKDTSEAWLGGIFLAMNITTLMKILKIVFTLLICLADLLFFWLPTRLWCRLAGQIAPDQPLKNNYWKDIRLGPA